MDVVGGTIARVARIRFLLLVALLGASTANASEPAQGILFRVESESGAIAHLMGSVHVGEPSFYPLSDVVESAFGRSEVLVVELDPTTVGPTDLALLERLARLPEGTRLEDLLSEATLRGLQAALARHGLPFDHVRGQKPWMISLTLMEMEFQRRGLSPELGVDRHFLDRRGARSLHTLETFAQQIEMLDQASAEMPNELLADSVGTEEETDEMMAQLIGSWRRGDLEGFEEAVFAELAERPALEPFYARMFFERNEQMTAKIEVLFGESRSLFVVVGAGHLVGERGIPALFAKKGYAVKRLGVTGGAP